ncbi:MAG TPA: hypothetical protein VF006_20395 [Longimicrobium sp.]
MEPFGSALHRFEVRRILMTCKGYALLVGLLLCASPSYAQLIPVPRLDRLVRADTTKFTGRDRLRLIRMQSRIAGDSVIVIHNDQEGALFWNQQPTELLVGSRFAFAEEEATLHSELAAVLSGAWRFSVGSTLSVSTGQGEGGDNVETAAEEDDATAEKAFKTFLAGGGNLSLQAVRPIGVRGGNYNAQFLFLTPRGWVNIPTVGVSENVDNGGAEIGAEYQYHRLRTDDGAPFLVVQLRGGVAFGTAKFHESIGRTEHSPFAYLAPALNFVVQDRVKIGVLGFFGPDSFDEMPRFRVNFEILGTEREEEVKGSTPQPPPAQQ